MNEDLKKIIDRLHHDDPQVRKDAAVALGEMESQEAISALMEMLTDSNPAVRYFVKRSLGRIRKVHTPRHEEVTKSLKDGEKPDINVDALEKYLNDPEYTKRMTAVKGTLKIGSPLAVPFLIDRLGIEEHDFVKSALSKAIGILGDEHVAERLVPFLKDPDSRVRANVIEGLEATGADILEYIVPCFTDSDNRVRGNAFRILGRYDREQAIGKLEDMYRIGDFSARLSAVFVLGKLGPDPQVTSILKEAMQASEEEVRELAQKALRELEVSETDSSGSDSAAAKSPAGEDVDQLIEVDQSVIAVATSKTRWGRIIAYGLLMVLVGVGIVSFPYLKKLYTYQRAKSALAAGRSEEALKRFAEITDFRNSEEFIREARFESILTESRKQIDRSDFEGALANLKKARSSFAEKVEIVPMIEETSKRMIMNAVEGEKFKTALGYREEFRNEFPASARELDGDLEDWFAAKTSTLDPKSDGGILLAILSEQYRFFPDDPDILRRVAAIKLDQAKQLLTKGDVDKAYSILRELDARYPGHGEIQKLLKTSEVKRVTASSGSKSVGYRIKELTDVLDKYPDSAQVRKDLVDLYLEQGLALDKEGEEKQARRVFKRALEITPNDERLISAVNAQHLREAGNLLSNKRFREAERELNAVRTVDTDLKKAAMIKRDLSVSEVRQIIKRNNFDMAAKRLEMLVDRYPKDREIPDLLKQVKIDRVKDLFDQGQYEDSIEEFKKLAEEYPSVSFDEEITQAKLEIASAYFRENRYLDAYRLYKEVLSSKPDDRRAIEGLIKSHFKAGQLYLEKKDFDKAMSEFQTVLKFDKNFSAAKAGLAESCLYLAKRYIKAGRLTEARQYVDASLRVFPDNEEAVSLEQIIRVKEMEKEYQAVGNPYIRRPAVEPGFEAEMLPGKPGTKPPRVQPDGKEEWRVMFSAIDQTGDDRGDGNYIYPIHDAYEPGAFDIVEFKVLVSSAQVAFKVRLKKDILKHYRSTNTNSDEREQSSFFQTGEGGWIFHMFDIYIDMDNRTGSGRREALPGRNVIFKAEDAWEKVILVSPENRSSMERTISHKSELPLLAELRRNIELPTVVFVKRDTFEVRIPIDAVGFPSSEWKYQILMMGYTRDDLPTSLRTIEVQAHADNNHFGGGSDYHGDSNVIDLLNPLGTSQFTMLSDYVSGPNRQKNRYPEIRMVKR